MARQVLFEHETEDGAIMRIVKGDLTEEPAEAIVNAANERLAHGGGVAGAIVCRMSKKPIVPRSAAAARRSRRSHRRRL